MHIHIPSSSSSSPPSQGIPIFFYLAWLSNHHPLHAIPFTLHSCSPFFLLNILREIQYTQRDTHHSPAYFHSITPSLQYIIISLLLTSQHPISTPVSNTNDTFIFSFISPFFDYQSSISQSTHHQSTINQAHPRGT